MNFFEAIVLSVIEGISEFLPISSTGHLILTSDILKIAQTDFVKDFEIIIQLGAILAIVFLYWDSLFKNSIIWKKVLTAFIPTGIIGFILFKFIKSFLLGNLYITLISLFLGGLILIILELIYKEKGHHVDKIENISYKNALLIGIFQSIAIIPGVSRSAATIIPALFLGTKRKAATEFSFLLAVPTMLAATSLDLVKSNFSYSLNEWLILLTGFIGALITAFIVVKWFLKYIQTHTFIPFGIYRIVLAILFFLIVIK
ncbi:MAG: undecaprenyl-diphosphate phosphatase [Patescibacteria group bacterium]